MVLAVVGKGWATAQFQDEERAGLLRLTEPEDWVRVEILAALAAGKVLIPVLCDGVELKSRKWLANFGLEALADQQAMRLRLEDDVHCPMCLYLAKASSLARARATRLTSTETSGCGL